MGNFLAAPFLLIAQACLYIASFCNGSLYILMEGEFEDDDEHYDGD